MHFSYYYMLNCVVGGRFGGGRGHHDFIGRSIRVCVGPFKGYKGVIKDVKGLSVRVELESQMRIITG